MSSSDAEACFAAGIRGGTTLPVSPSAWDMFILTSGAEPRPYVYNPNIPEWQIIYPFPRASAQPSFQGNDTDATGDQSTGSLNFNAETITTGNVVDGNAWLTVKEAGIMIDKLRLVGGGNTEVLTGGLAVSSLTSCTSLATNASGVFACGAAAGVTIYGKTAGTPLANDATEQSQFAPSIPGGTLGTLSAVQVYGFFRYLNNSGSNQTLTLRLKYGATTVCTIQIPGIVSNIQERTMQFRGLLSARGATNAQAASCFGQLSNGMANDGTDSAGSFAERLSAHDTVTEDSTGALTLDITAQHSAANANLSVTLQSMYAEIKVAQ